MARKRMTADERRQADYDAVAKQWALFRPKLEAAGTLAAAQALVAESPGEGTPGRQFYSNLGFFLQAFTIPNGSSNAERDLYLDFVRRLDAVGALKPGALTAIEERFR